ncbi:hypothetical protein I3843_12G021400 [Carya illinoinensis]|nr:hypothetical protein I3843_12G021400 [Carya illinoinensis]
MAHRSFKRFVEQELGKFPHFLIFTMLEWVMIIMLFIDGLLAFVANEFAKLFELQVPCLLCTRIAHALVHRDPEFYYNDWICEAHKKDVSPLAYCHNHKKLSDVRKMCEGCLFSFAIEKDSDCMKHKPVVEILNKDLECFVGDDSQMPLSSTAGKNDDIVHAEKSSIRYCSCCGDPLKVKSSYSKGKCANAFSLSPTPSPRAPFVTLSRETCSLNSPRTRYAKSKFISEHDSVPEDGLNGFNPNTQVREDAKATTVLLLTEYEDLNGNASKSPNFGRGNRFFGISPTNSANNSPRFGTRSTRKSPLGKTMFASGCTEENLPIIEADGDYILHHLKRQVQLDRKSLIALYMELDVERSASTIAANNAMAMITRLQAEKAAVQMEALQYQRMMEEEAEYDQDVLQETIDLLAKREEEIRVLKDELEEYREKYGSLRKDGFERVEVEANEDYLDSNSSVNEEEINGEDAYGTGTQSESLKEFKGQETHPLRRLKNLEKRNHFLSENGALSLESSSNSVDKTNDETGKQRKPVLTREHLSQRVKDLEADNGFLEHAAQTLEKHSEGARLLIEISRNMRKLRQLVTMNLKENDD